MFLKDLEDVVVNTIDTVNKDNSAEKERKKKKIAVKAGQELYNQVFDKPFNLPVWVDYPVKFVVIPFAVELISHVIKNNQKQV